MRLLVVMVGLALAAAAFAQYSTTVPTVAAVPATTATVAPAVTTGVTCPPGAATLNGPCAAMAAQSLTNDTIVLVLSTQERYAMENLPVRSEPLERFPMSYRSIFQPENPISYWSPNAVVTRHGNPYYPYYQLYSPSLVAGRMERFVQYPASVSSDAQAALNAVTTRYRSLTTQQAIALGYQPVGACISGLGQVYLNQRLVDNVFDPMTPEAFTFSRNGKILSAQYILVSAVPVLAFGQQMQPSTLVAGALQLPVWLFQGNRNGLFAATNPAQSCQ